MNTPELLRIRLFNQLLKTHSLKDPHEIVSWMGAMQSQSLDLAKWGIGVRLLDSNVNDVEEALNTGKIVRTHILRPTWHFVAGEDIHWMLDLSLPRLKPVYLSYCKILGVAESHIASFIPILVESLSGRKHLSKQEIGEALEQSRGKLDPNLLKMVISLAEMERLICNGRLNKGNKQTYTLLEEWVPRNKTLLKEEALSSLTKKYFESHGPATIHDFAWWSGLTLTECRKGLEMVKESFVSESTNDRVFWMKNDIRLPSADELSALLLPPFDEFVVSYKDRSEIIEDEHYGKVMTKNGLFSPTVMFNGEIVGSWKKTVKKGNPQVELQFFKKTPKKIQDHFKSEIKRLEKFYS